MWQWMLLEYLTNNTICAKHKLTWYNLYGGNAMLRFALTDCSSKTLTADQLQILQGTMGHEGASSIGCWLKSCRRQAGTPTCRWDNQLPIYSLTLSSSQMFDFDKRPWGFTMSVKLNKPCHVIHEMRILLLQYRFKALVTRKWLHLCQDCVLICVFRLRCSACPAALSKSKETAIILKNCSHCGS